jgi:hypothetical protein
MVDLGERVSVVATSVSREISNDSELTRQDLDDRAAAGRRRS